MKLPVCHKWPPLCSSLHAALNTDFHTTPQKGKKASVSERERRGIELSEQCNLLLSAILPIVFLFPSYSTIKGEDLE